VWLSAGRAAVVSAAQTLAIALAGGVLARSKLVGGRTTFRDMATLVCYVFTPCLTIAELTEAVSFDTLSELWLLPACGVLIVLVGALVGRCVAAVCDPTGKYTPVIVCCCAMGNALALPLSLSLALTLNVPWIGDDSVAGTPHDAEVGGEGAHDTSLVSYVFIYTCTDSFILFGPVHMYLGRHALWLTRKMARAAEGQGHEQHAGAGGTTAAAAGRSESDTIQGGARTQSGVGDEEQLPLMGVHLSGVDVTDADRDGMDDAGGEPTSLLAAALGDEVGDGRAGGCRCCRALLRDLMNPMLGGLGLALAIAMVEPARRAFVGTPVHRTMRFAGGAATPLMLANLGATMMYTDSTGDDGDKVRVLVRVWLFPPIIPVPATTFGTIVHRRRVTAQPSCLYRAVSWSVSSLAGWCACTWPSQALHH
jgi:predicted permease